MELSSKKASDITYLSELTPPFWQVRPQGMTRQKGGVKFAHTTYVVGHKDLRTP